MFVWALVNIALSVLALLFALLNSTAPHRLRFLACFAAVFAWLLPWQLLPEVFSELVMPAGLSAFFDGQLGQVEQQVAITSARITGAPVVISIGVAGTGSLMIFSKTALVLLAFSVVGLLLFAASVLRHHLQLQLLEQKAGNGDWLWRKVQASALDSAVQASAPAENVRAAKQVPVKIQNEIPGAFSSGLFQPCIWVHSDLLQSPQLATLLQHELRHIQQHDNWYLLAITFTEKLFWWNPLLQYLVAQTRELLELSCDEHCQRSIADYPAQLAQLMLDSAKSGSSARQLVLSANILSKPNPNIKRIQLLQRSYVMKPRHVVSAVVTAVFTIGLVTAQPETTQAQRTIMIDRVGGPGVAEPNAGFFVINRAAEAGVTAAGQQMIFSTAEAGPDGGPVMFTTGSAGFFRSQPGIEGRPEVAQFLKVAEVNGERQISLDFTDTPLPMVLEPLANLGGVAFAPAVWAQAVPGTIAMNNAVTGTRVIPAPGQDTFTVQTGVPAMAAVAMPFNSKLVLEADNARDKLVSVEGENLSLKEALDLIGEAANCSIFQEGDTIVVDWCGN